MNWAAIALYVPVAFVSTLLPGPNALLALSHGAAFGPLRTLYTAAGINAAVLAMMLLSYLGAGSIASWLDDHFVVYRLACTAVLAVIGLQMILGRPSPVTAPAPRVAAVAGGRLFVTGLFVGAGNPKALLFFFLVFPGFIAAAGGARLPQFTVLALIWLACEFFGLMVYAVAGQRLMRRLSQRGGRRLLNVACGALILVMAVGLWFIAPSCTQRDTGICARSCRRIPRQSTHPLHSPEPPCLNARSRSWPFAALPATPRPACSSFSTPAGTSRPAATPTGNFWRSSPGAGRRFSARLRLPASLRSAWCSRFG